MNFNEINVSYEIRKIDEHNILDLYNLCKGNTFYYDCIKEEVSLESVKGIIEMIPKGKTAEDKLSIGFYKEEKLYAVLDLIIGFPNEKTCYIWLFMIENKLHKKGIGSEILKEILEFIKNNNFEYTELGIVATNNPAKKFWYKNGFIQNGDEIIGEKYKVIPMIKKL